MWRSCRTLVLDAREGGMWVLGARRRARHPSPDRTEWARERGRTGRALRCPLHTLCACPAKRVRTMIIVHLAERRPRYIDRPRGAFQVAGSCSFEPVMGPERSPSAPEARYRS